VSSASARPAGNHRQSAPHRLRSGQSLPVGRLPVEGEQPRQAVGKTGFVNLRRVAGAGQQAFGQLLFISLVAREVEPLAIEDQRRIGARPADQWRSLELGAPGLQRG